MIISKDLINNKSKFIEQIMILICNEDEQLFNDLFTKDWDVFTEPLLFSYFNQRNRDKRELRLLFSGVVNFVHLSINFLDYGKSIYLPKFGFFFSDNDGFTNIEISSKNDEVFFFQGANSLVIRNIGKQFIGNHNFELLYQPIRLLRQCYYDTDGNLLNVNVFDHNSKQFQFLNNALDLIRKYVPEYYALLCIVLKKIVVFQCDSTLRNSFADLAAHGVIFLNAYQSDYDEVFFVDDVAHQAGHVIMNTLLFEKSEYLNVHYDTTVEEIINDNIVVEKRNILVIFHALYTYYTTFTCLDACLKAKVFDKRQTHEALGRIKFYIFKCAHDLLCIDKKSQSIDLNHPLFTGKGQAIFNAIREKQMYMINNYWNKIAKFKLDNQPYNFTYSKFIKLNNLENV